MPRVAVIAVHGVADQDPGETSRAIANLLANVDEAGRSAYGPFVTTPLSIPVRRLPVPDEASHDQHGFHDYAAAQRRRLSIAPDAEHVAADLAFTASLLAKYKPSGPEETYETTVVSTERRAHADAPARDVDIYEMYWADLSRLTRSWLRMFAELYQLLFHVGSLGVHAIRAAVADETSVSTPEGWDRWARVQRTAANLLARDTLILNLCLAGLLVVMASLLPAARTAAVLVGLSGAVASMAITGVFFYRGRLGPRSVTTAVLVSLVVAGAFAFLGWWLTGHPARAQQALATSLLAVVAAAFTYVAIKYDEQRPGAAWRAVWYGVPLGLFVLAQIWFAGPSASGAGIPAALLHGAEAVYFALRLVWIVFLLSVITALVLGRLLVRSATGDAAERVGRLHWTAQLTLSLPAFLFLLLTVVLWSTLWQAIDWPGVDAVHRPLWTTRLMVTTLAPLSTVQDVVDGLILNAAGPGLVALMVLGGLAAIVLTFAVAPSVLSEVRPPLSARDGTRSGQWLDSGLRAARLAGRLLIFGVLIVLPAGYLVERFVAAAFPDQWQRLAELNPRVLMTIATALGAGGAGLLVFGDKLKAITLGFRNVLDVLLDVDNYLREHPRESTPRARMFTRMASLLRHVYALKYDAVVIIAHSQGTVITADLLRFITVQQLGAVDPTLQAPAGMPIRLFTMGSPLRQLYGLRFPHLYRWARHESGETWTDPKQVIPPSTVPDPASLGVTHWVNAYRSGDYVGRYLWRPDRCDFRYMAPSSDASHPWQAGALVPTFSESEGLPGRREFCIGAGAHTHYWDRSAPQIALELDELIVR